jgi:hypothetical protein
MAFGLLLATVLVLRTGDRIDVAGDVKFEGQNAVFRTADGALYSLPVSEIATVSADGAAAPAKPRAAESKAADADAEARRKLKLSAEQRQKLLDELARNRGGQPPVRQAMLDDPPPPPAKKPSEAEQTADEWRWRREARDHDERVLRSKENLALLHDRVEQLRSEIYNLMSLGYKPSQFSYQTTQLQYALDSIPDAELEVRRAERARDQFREDARRQGILPGWLR